MATTETLVGEVYDFGDRLCGYCHGEVLTCTAQIGAKVELMCDDCGETYSAPAAIFGGVTL